MNFAGPDAIIQILLNSNIEDIAKYCQINRQARYICQNNHFWQQKYFKDFGQVESNLNTNWYQLYQKRYKLKWALNPKKGFIIMLGRTPIPAIIYGKSEEDIINKLMYVYNNDLFDNPLYDIVEKLISHFNNYNIPFQHFKKFINRAGIFIWDINIYRNKSEKAFAIIGDARLMPIAVIYGNNESDIIQKVVDIYNNNISDSPLYHLIDEVMQDYSSKFNFVKPITAEDFWKFAQNDIYTEWYIFPTTIYQ